MTDTTTPARPPTVDELGYRSPTACQVAGITFRQCDYWCRTELVTPSLREAHGHGTQRLYTLHDVVLLSVTRRLLDCGISLQNIRRTIAVLREYQVDEFTNVTALCDGDVVWLLDTAAEVFDVLQSGDAMYAVAVGKTLRDVQAALADLPGESTLPPLQVVS